MQDNTLNWQDVLWLSGSLEIGKKADFVVLKEDVGDLMEEKLWQVKMYSTFIGGVKVYWILMLNFVLCMMGEGLFQHQHEFRFFLVAFKRACCSVSAGNL